MLIPNKIEKRSEGEGEKRGKKKEWEKRKKEKLFDPLRFS